MNRGKRGQVWVETVIYTLIGLAIIGIVLGIAKPKIEEKKDEITIEQSIDSLEKINSKILEVKATPGNRRTIELSVKSGTFSINMDEDKIYWDIDSSFEYSEVDIPVQVGSVLVKTTGVDPWKVRLEEDPLVSIIFGSFDSGIKVFTPSPTPYKLTVENTGELSSEGKTVIKFEEA